MNSSKKRNEPAEKPEEIPPAASEPAENGADPVAAKAPAENPLQAENTRLSEENARLRDQWIRAVADADNIRKRAQREQEDTARYAVTAFARDMVSVLENLKRASDSLPQEKRDGNDLLKTLGEGVDLTLQELLGIFARYHINRIDPQGQKFDHNLHQAVAQVERDDVPPGTVVQVVQAGYTIHDRLLRPAMVAVSKQGDPAKKVDTTA